jgi:dipeptidyl aminopeptidase/acylaminoacyl peptidase
VAFSPLPQALAAQGWVVFQPNYRGSDNLGDAYARAILNDSGAGPGRDVMAGIETLARRGYVDRERMVVGGWSYGGYMTTWMIGHYRSKAAVAGAAVTNSSTATCSATAASRAIDLGLRSPPRT